MELESDDKGQGVDDGESFKTIAAGVEPVEVLG